MKRILIFLCLFSSLIWIQRERLIDAQKQADFEARKPEIIKRLSETAAQLPEETKLIVKEVREYNQGKSQSLELISSILKPGNKSEHKLYVINRLRMDTTTLPMFIKLLREEKNDYLKEATIFRFRKDVLQNKIEAPPEIMELLELYSTDINEDAGIRYAAKLTLRQIIEKSEQSVFRWPIVGAVAAVTAIGVAAMMRKR